MTVAQFHPETLRSRTGAHSERVRVLAMPERDNDPIANTQMFRAFVQRNEEPQTPTRRSPLPIITAVVAVLVIAAVVAWLLVR